MLSVSCVSSCDNHDVYDDQRDNLHHNQRDNLLSHQPRYAAESSSLGYLSQVTSRGHDDISTLMIMWTTQVSQSQTKTPTSPTKDSEAAKLGNNCVHISLQVKTCFRRNECTCIRINSSDSLPGISFISFVSVHHSSTLRDCISKGMWVKFMFWCFLSFSRCE